MDDTGERSIAEIFQQRKDAPPLEVPVEDVEQAPAAFLRYLAIALCVQTGVSPSEADANARGL